jgi:chromatin segregation and condensation protein Rec8/ScpA/Scc1 (kleisin family)
MEIRIASEYGTAVAIIHGMKSRSSDANRADSGARQSRSSDPIEDDDTLVEKPDTFEDYDELSGDGDATPDDRRRDPLRRSW